MFASVRVSPSARACVPAKLPVCECACIGVQGGIHGTPWRCLQTCMCAHLYVRAMLLVCMCVCMHAFAHAYLHAYSQWLQIRMHMREYACEHGIPARCCCCRHAHSRTHYTATSAAAATDTAAANCFVAASALLQLLPEPDRVLALVLAPCACACDCHIVILLAVVLAHVLLPVIASACNIQVLNLAWGIALLVLRSLTTVDMLFRHTLCLHRIHSCCRKCRHA